MPKKWIKLNIQYAVYLISKNKRALCRKKQKSEVILSLHAKRILPCSKKSSKCNPNIGLTPRVIKTSSQAFLSKQKDVSKPTGGAVRCQNYKPVLNKSKQVNLRMYAWSWKLQLTWEVHGSKRWGAKALYPWQFSVATCQWWKLRLGWHRCMALGEIPNIPSCFKCMGRNHPPIYTKLLLESNALDLQWS